MNTKYIFPIILSIVFFGSGCGKTAQTPLLDSADPNAVPAQITTIPTSSTTEAVSTQKPTAEQAPSQTVTYSLIDVAQHSSASNCWQIINHKVYNVTSYISKHPGGPSIVQGCGKDATTLFDSIGAHGNIQSLLAGYYIGDLN
ncbi:MAG: cytochrome b5-like heme/steroid binding domain-containing protein [Patescibacteria group bacterium]|jgi:cytochrome b involved in lipid metabolism